MIELLLILLVALCLRLPFLASDSTDAWVHLWKVELVRRKGFRYALSHRVPDSVIDDCRHPYPCLPYCATSFFPKRFWLAAGKLMNITYDLLAIVIVYCAARGWVFADADGPVELLAISAPGVTALLFATMPALLPVTARFRAIGARTIGSLLGIGYLVLIGIGLTGGPWWALVAAAMIPPIAQISSKFGVQAIAFFSVAISVFLLTPWPIIVFLGGMLAGAAIPGMNVWLTMKGQIEHLRWYAASKRQGTAIEHRNRLVDFLMLPIFVLRRPMHAAQLVFSQLTPFIAIVAAPALMWWVWWLASDWSGSVATLTDGPVMRYLTACAAASVILTALTSLRALLIFGQAERYLIYGAPFIAVITVAMLRRPDVPDVHLWVLLALHLCGAMSNYLYVMRAAVVRQLAHDKVPEECEVSRFLDELGGARVLALPTKLSPLLSYWSDGRARFYYDFLLIPGKGTRYMLEATPKYMQPRTDLQYFRREYGIDTFVVHKPFLKALDVDEADYRLGQGNLLFENDAYKVYRIPDAPPKPNDAV